MEAGREGRALSGCRCEACPSEPVSAPHSDGGTAERCDTATPSGQYATTMGLMRLSVPHVKRMPLGLDARWLTWSSTSAYGDRCVESRAGPERPAVGSWQAQGVEPLPVPRCTDRIPVGRQSGRRSRFAELQGGLGAAVGTHLLPPYLSPFLDVCLSCNHVLIHGARNTL